MKFATAVFAAAVATTTSTTVASARHQNRGTIRRGLVEEKEDGMSSMLDTNKHKGTGNTGNTGGSSDEPDIDTDVCNSKLVNYVGLWEAIDESDGRNVKASIKCFKNGELIPYMNINISISLYLTIMLFLLSNQSADVRSHMLILFLIANKH